MVGSVDEEFWRLPVVKQKTGLPRSEIYSRMQNDKFPKQRRYSGSNGVYWLASEVRAWQQLEIVGGMLT